MAEVTSPEPWRYYPSLRQWARGTRIVIVPQCPAVLDSHKMLRAAGVILIGDVQCQREAGHEATHRHPWPYPAEWSDQWTKCMHPTCEDDRG